MALRPRANPSSMASRCTAHALAEGASSATPKSVITAMAGFASAGTAAAADATSGQLSPVFLEGVNSAPKSVVTFMAGFAGGGPASAPVVVAGGRSAIAVRCPHRPGGLTATPASLR